MSKGGEGATLHPELQGESVHWSRTHGQNRLVALVHSPRTLFFYWELKDATKGLVAAYMGRPWTQLETVLRIYDVTDVRFDGNNARRHLDTVVQPASDNWYVHNLTPGREYIAVFGVTATDGQLLGLLQSTAVRTPSVERLEMVGEQDEPSSPTSDPLPWAHQFTGYSLDESV